MHLNIQLIRIKVDRPKNLRTHRRPYSPTICGLFLLPDGIVGAHVRLHWSELDDLGIKLLTTFPTVLHTWKNRHWFQDGRHFYRQQATFSSFSDMGKSCCWKINTGRKHKISEIYWNTHITRSRRQNKPSKILSNFCWTSKLRITTNGSNVMLLAASSCLQIG